MQTQTKRVADAFASAPLRDLGRFSQVARDAAIVLKSGPGAGQAAAALAAASALCGVPVAADDLIHRLSPGGGFDPSAMLRAARALGLKARVLTPDLARLGGMPVPAVGRDREGYAFVLTRVAVDEAGVAERVILHYPGGRSETLPLADFLARRDGPLVLLQPPEAAGDRGRPFGLSWIFGAASGRRRLPEHV